jgi:hypothetical protein
MLGRLFFYHGKGKNGGMKLESLNIVDFSQVNGKQLSSIRTVCGRNFVDFHHELFDTCYERRSHTFFDTSDWLHFHGTNAKMYYRAFLSLFVRHGVLFENILLNDQERAFTTNVLLPAFIWVQRRFGVKPLIVPLTPIEDEDSRLWMCYPGTDKYFVTERTGSIA